MSNDSAEPFDTDTAVAELIAAGWIPDGRRQRWLAPNGTLWRGPAGAWRVMKREADERAAGDDYRQSKAYLRRLLRDCAPDVVPEETLMGIALQLDNLVAGLMRAARQPSSADAVDPHAASTGTLSTRA